MDDMDRQVPGEVVDGPLMALPPGLPPGQALQQVRTQYVTAVAVQQPRRLAEVRRRLLEEAALAGEEFYYSWGGGKNHVEGASIELAAAAARCYGNSAVEVAPVQETAEAWYITTSFIDLETGFTMSRQFRQSRRSKIAGGFDGERKDDMRFAIGQSKSARNVILKCVPKSLIREAMAEAKKGVRQKIEKYISDNGMPKAIDYVLGQLGRHGVKEPAVLEKLGLAAKQAITVDQIVVLRGDLHAIESGQEFADTLYPLTAEAKQAEGKQRAEDVLSAAQAEQPAAPEAPAPEPPAKKGRAGKAQQLVQEVLAGTDLLQRQAICDEFGVPGVDELSVQQCQAVLARLKGA